MNCKKAGLGRNIADIQFDSIGPSELLTIRSLSKINQREFNPKVFILKLRTTRKVLNNNTED